MVINTVMGLAFLVFLGAVRPFQSGFSNFKIITIYGMLFIIDCGYLTFQIFASKQVYSQSL
jgi:hypothetical protein